MRFNSWRRSSNIVDMRTNSDVVTFADSLYAPPDHGIISTPQMLTPMAMAYPIFWIISRRERLAQERRDRCLRANIERGRGR